MSFKIDESARWCLIFVACLGLLAGTVIHAEALHCSGATVSIKAGNVPVSLADFQLFRNVCS